MLRSIVASAVAAVGLLLAGGTVASAQVGAPSQRGCQHHIGEASGATRETALQLAYEGVLEAVDPSTRRTWIARGRRIGEAPGYEVRKISSKCAARGAGQSCTIDALICRG